MRCRRVREAPGVRSQRAARAGGTARAPVVRRGHTRAGPGTRDRGYLRRGAGKVVIKAQVLVGGRGKAGGVKLAASPDEAERGRGLDPGHGYQGHHRPPGARGTRGGHRRASTTSRPCSTGPPAHPADGLGRGRRGDRAGGRGPTPTPSCRCSRIRTSGCSTTRRARSRSRWASATAGRRPCPSSRACSRPSSTNDADLVEINPLAVVPVEGR